MSAPADREFEVLRKGFVRDRVILANFRNGLRDLTNPETGLPFTEQEIQRATQPGSRWWIEADSIDAMGQLEQRRAIFLSDQARMERANTNYLENFHGRLWGEDKLPATGGSGTMNVPGVAGTVVLGSTTIPDPAAYWGIDAAGKRYQAFTTTIIPAGGVADVTMAAIDVGADTNLKIDDTFTWSYKDPNMEPQGTVALDFSGGTDAETDAEYASRMLGNRRHKPASGNDAHFRSWARAASNAIEDGFVYPTALHAGSVVVAVTQKRANVLGPLARIPSPTTLAAATARLVPPSSAVVPGRAWVVVVPTQSKGVVAAARITMQRGTDAGWADVTPFPTYTASLPSITALASQTDFTLRAGADATLPGQPSGATLVGAAAPQLMVWDAATSAFYPLSIASIQDLTGSDYRVQLTAPVAITLAPGQLVSPKVARHAIIAQAVEDYFDELGPGDLFDLTSDVRSARCVRFPPAIEERPSRAGASLAIRIIEALGGSSADATLPVLTYSTPPYPTTITDGPYMLTILRFGVYAL